MAAKIILVTILLVVVTAFHQDPPSLHKSLPVHRLAVDTESTSPANSALQHLTEEFEKPVEQSCYAFMRLRPAGQQGDAVQARLRHADRMTSAFDPNLLTVDVLGDHANILSLEFPVVWPDNPAHVRQVSSVVNSYFSSPEIKDYLCQAGFDQVRLSARDVNDEKSHSIWQAQVTTDGLVRSGLAPSNRP
jgi:hypothetical protein